MGVESSVPVPNGVNQVCCSCHTTDRSESRGKWRKCEDSSCPLVYCSECKKKYMYKIQKGRWLCAQHQIIRSNHQKNQRKQNGRNSNEMHPNTASSLALNTSVEQTAIQQEMRPISARHPAPKRGKPPTPSLTPGADLYGTRQAYNKRPDMSTTPNFGAMDPSISFSSINSQEIAGMISMDPNNDLVEDEQQTYDNSGFHMPAPISPSVVNSASLKLNALKGQNQFLPPPSAPMNHGNVLDQSTPSQNSMDVLNKLLMDSADQDLAIPGLLEDNDGTGSKPRYWTETEDQLLRTAVEQYGAKHWKTIATFVPNRTHVQCLQRWNKVLKPGLKKGAWQKSEDNTLLSVVNSMQPTINWTDVAKNISGRNAKQCRERWCFNLDPSIKKGDWTEEEDKILIDTQAKIGNRWAQISTLLPGRTENAIKTRHKSILRAKKREWRKEEDELLLELHSKLGSRWEDIVKRFQNRSKNAIRTRYKYLTSEDDDTNSHASGQSKQSGKNSENHTKTKNEGHAMTDVKTELPAMNDLTLNPNQQLEQRNDPKDFVNPGFLPNGITPSQLMQKDLSRENNNAAVSSDRVQKQMYYGATGENMNFMHFPQSNMLLPSTGLGQQSVSASTGSMDTPKTGDMMIAYLDELSADIALIKEMEYDENVHKTR